jgi:cytochrome P450
MGSDKSRLMLNARSGAIAWGLFALARHPEVQQQLRTECLSYGENLPFEQMNELPFLDATVKEILRMNPSFPNTVSHSALFNVPPSWTLSRTCVDPYRP